MLGWGVTDNPQFVGAASAAKLTFLKLQASC